MAFGTAGLTAALCVTALMHAGMTPERQPLIWLVVQLAGWQYCSCNYWQMPAFQNRVALVRTPDQQQQVRALGATATLAPDELPKAGIGAPTIDFAHRSAWW